MERGVMWEPMSVSCERFSPAEAFSERTGDVSGLPVTPQGSTGRPGGCLSAPGGTWCGAAVPSFRCEVCYESCY